MSMDNKVGGAGGDSNTPHKTYNARATCIDYFTFRINHGYEKEKDVFNSLLKILRTDTFEAKKTKGRNNYTDALILAQGISLLYGGHLTISKEGTQTTVLELKGSGCREFEERYYCLGKDFKTKPKQEVIRDGWIKLFEECLALGGVCTRIDLPTDDFSGLIKVSEIKSKLHKHEYSTRMRKIESTAKDNEVIAEEDSVKEPSKLNGVHTVQENESLGFTATFGSRRTVQLCIYDKKAEQTKKGLHRDIDSWIRYEVRYYHQNAELELPLLLDALRNGNESKHIVSCLAAIIEFKEAILFQDSNRSKNKVWSKWASFIGDAGKKDSFANVPRTMTVESNAAWLAIDASACIGKLASCVDDLSYADILGAFIARWTRNIDEEHLQAINQYRISKGKKPFRSKEQLINYHLSREDFPESFSEEIMELVLKVSTTNKEKDKQENSKEEDDESA